MTTSISSPPSIRSQGVRKSFSDVTALDGLDFEVGPGVTILLGPNGAGKTTLLRCLATVMRPDGGTIEICGIRIGNEPDNRAARSRLGYMPQTAGFNRALSVRRHLERVAVLRGIGDRPSRTVAIDMALEAVGLTSQSDRKIKALSGGMRRRLALSQALIGSPEVLILDEPTAGLDPEQRAVFRSIVGTVANSGASVLVSTHQPEDVMGISGSVMVLAQGRLHFQGTPDDLAEQARGKVWLAEQAPPGLPSWPIPDGRVRVLGEMVAGEPITPTLEDGYLVIMRRLGASIQP